MTLTADQTTILLTVCLPLAIHFGCSLLAAFLPKPILAKLGPVLTVLNAVAVNVHNAKPASLSGEA